MIQVKCKECGTTNRLEGFSNQRIPYCGSCKIQLSEPIGVVATRFLIGLKYWIILGAIGLGVFFTDGSKRESASTPAAAPSVHAQFTDQPVNANPYRKPLTFTQGVNSVKVDEPLLAPFRIVTPVGKERYFVKLVDSTTGRDIMTMNIHSGQSFEAKVPLGRFKVRYASGLQWYGEEENILFGEDTTTSESDDIFDFNETAEGISGYTIELIKQVNGNMHTREIPKSRF